MKSPMRALIVDAMFEQSDASIVDMRTRGSSVMLSSSSGSCERLRDKEDRTSCRSAAVVPRSLPEQHCQSEEQALMSTTHPIQPGLAVRCMALYGPLHGLRTLLLQLLQP